MNANAEKWLAALESGEYQQTRLGLRDDVGFCCLGVACDLAVKAGVPLKVKPSEDGSWSYDGDDGLLPASVMTWLGIESRLGRYEGSMLSRDNDSGASFAEIAQTIRTHPELFVDES